MAAGSSPGWRRAFDTAERAIGGPLTRATRSDRAGTALVTLVRLRRAVARSVDGVVSAGLHVVGLPSYRDIRSLRRQVGAVERELGGLRRDMDAGAAGGPKRDDTDRLP